EANAASGVDSTEPIWHARALHARGFYRNRRGLALEALQDLEASLQAARSAHDRLLEGRVLHAIAYLSYWQNDFQEADQRFSEALLGHRGSGGDRYETITMAALGRVRWQRGRLDEATRLLEHALFAHDERSDPVLASDLASFASLYLDQARLDEAQEAFDRAL